MTSIYRAATCTALTGPDSIRINEIETKPLQTGEVRIAVKAAGLNFPDLLMTYGKYQFRPDPPFVPGLEVAGEVIEIASDVTAFAIGDRVMGGSKGNGFAEQIVLPETAARPLPEALSFTEGACWHGAAITAWHALNDKAALRAEETILILGASGGVGMAAVKLAKHKGAVVIATGSNNTKRTAIEEAGVDHSLDPADPKLAAKVKALTDGKGVDVVFDPVGGDLAITATRSISWGGRYLIVGFASGDIPAFPANHALIKGYSLIGLRAGESARRDRDLAERSEQALSSLAAEGVMRPHISHSFTLDNAADALRILEQRAVIGRAVIDMTL
ncbi:NADPH:quinone oxidoreductase family protein [Parasphingorhabdus cellanae]|uniref:NADPH:quinone oxidoreductase family protein n=1 Tax=Parasphingorhabdus cellanae TaxID=2806553 RepID=A0ABX7T628_9SPHN|nr:NADPH:quinone oxidoreductase family protein [Parasphingorhabdus cellanae]QTD56576.1 NADPH:quinone oxidoreductase family protein [Parasphingorhabdus cellanae]